MDRTWKARGESMKRNRSFYRDVAQLAVPVALQSMLQSSFGIVDQVMIGQLGSVSIAGVGLAGKFSSIFSVVISAIGAVAGIMISQYLGQKNIGAVRRSFFCNLAIGAVIAAGFTALCALWPQAVMRLYSNDPATVEAAAEYLSVIAWTFLPLAGATLLSTLFRCADRPRLPLYASIVSALLNTVLNYLLIFGKAGLPQLGARGAAIATLLSQLANALLMLGMLPRAAPLPRRDAQAQHAPFLWRQYLTILLPILTCEALWSVGENVYAAIYGHMSTDSTAAMTLINPVQGLMIGALCGLSQAAGVIVGKRLGAREFDEAYRVSKKLLLCGALCALVLAVAVVALSGVYVKIYQVDGTVRQLTRQILFAYALISPFKVLNMILGGGILRSGGKTWYVMAIDIIGTWVFGVPLGLLSAFVWKLPIASVYFLLSLEEVVRFALSVFVFRRRRWMQQLQAE